MKKRTLVFLLTLALAVAMVIPMAVPVASNPVLIGRWQLNGNTNDISGNGLNGTLTGAATHVTGRYGQALNFDGNSWVSIADASILEPTQITVEAWVKRSGSPGGCCYVVSKYLPDRYGGYSSYGLYTGGGGISFYVGNSGSWTASPEVPAASVWNGNWHHVAGTFDGTNVKLYFDGDPFDGTPTTAQPIYYSGTGNLYIGAYTATSWLAFSGMIDEVRIWGSALTESQLDVMYDFVGLQSPYAAPPKAFKVGSSIPFKWQYSFLGNIVASADTDPMIQVKFSSAGSEPTTLTEEDAAGASGLRYDPVTMTWQFNWQTKGLTAGVYNITITSGLTGKIAGPFPIQLK